MSRAYVKDNLLSTFPFALTSSKKLNAIADATAEELTKLYELNRLADIYTRIDELDEELCDILAYDYKIDWYMWAAPLAAKRALIKSHFEVHRHMGTRGGVEKALNSVYPGTFLEEWFEYGGRPYYFRIVFDVTEHRADIRQTELERMIRIFKDVRSVMETDQITIRSRATILVGCTFTYALFNPHFAGTIPYEAMPGRIYNDAIVVNGSGLDVFYPVPMTDQVVTGTLPEQAEQGRIYSDVIDAYGIGKDTAYLIAEANDYPVGTVPEPVVKGGVSRGIVDVGADLTDANFAVATAGTKPYAAERGQISNGVIATTAGGIDADFALTPAGTVPYEAERGSIYTDTVEAMAGGFERPYAVADTGDTLTGTSPYAAEQGQIYMDTVEAASLGIDRAYVPPSSGTAESGTIPSAAEHGGKNANTVTANAETVDSAYSSPSSGTTDTGTVPQAAASGGVTQNAVNAAAQATDTGYQMTETGTIPEPSTANGTTRGGDIGFDATGDSAGFNAQYCGTPFGSPLK